MFPDKFDVENCRVCGFHYVNYLPWGDDGLTPSYDICVCCFTEFGFDDTSLDDIRRSRQQWIMRGKTFYDHTFCPEDWDADEQLKSIPARYL